MKKIVPEKKNKKINSSKTMKRHLNTVFFLYFARLRTQSQHVWVKLTEIFCLKVIIAFSLLIMNKTTNSLLIMNLSSKWHKNREEEEGRDFHDLPLTTISFIFLSNLEM